MGSWCYHVETKGDRPYTISTREIVAHSSHREIERERILATIQLKKKKKGRERSERGM